MLTERLQVLAELLRLPSMRRTSRRHSYAAASKRLSEAYGYRE